MRAPLRGFRQGLLAVTGEAGANFRQAGVFRRSCRLDVRDRDQDNSTPVLEGQSQYPGTAVAQPEMLDPLAESQVTIGALSAG